MRTKVLDVSDVRHYRINQSELFADRDNHINGIENFWNQTKRHMRKFNAVPKERFPFFLKECEWRFNTPDLQSQLKQLKQGVNAIWAEDPGLPQNRLVGELAQSVRRAEIRTSI